MLSRRSCVRCVSDGIYQLASCHIALPMSQYLASMTVNVKIRKNSLYHNGHNVRNRDNI